MKRFLKEMVCNPDKSYSSKRMGGWISLFTTIIYGFINKPEHIMFTMTGLVVAFFGLTSIDYKSFLNNKSTPAE